MNNEQTESYASDAHECTPPSVTCTDCRSSTCSRPPTPPPPSSAPRLEHPLQPPRPPPQDPRGCRPGDPPPLRGRRAPHLPLAEPARGLARAGRTARRRPPAARRVVFVCTANTARSHLAAALWRQASPDRGHLRGHPPRRTHQPRRPRRGATPPPRPARGRPAARSPTPSTRATSSSPCATAPTRSSATPPGPTGRSPTPSPEGSQGGVRRGPRRPGRTSGLGGSQRRTRPQAPRLSDRCRQEQMSVSALRVWIDSVGLGLATRCSARAAGRVPSRLGTSTTVGCAAAQGDPHPARRGRRSSPPRAGEGRRHRAGVLGVVAGVLDDDRRGAWWSRPSRSSPGVKPCTSRASRGLPRQARRRRWR